jgi:hypothetical protein
MERVVGVLLLALAAGCGGSDEQGVGGPARGIGGFAAGAATGGQGGGGGLALDAGGGVDAAPDAPVGVGGAPTYPAGPYGNQVGSVLPNLEMLGYLRHDTAGLASEATLATVHFADLRASAPKSFAMIHISGFT